MHEEKLHQHYSIEAIQFLGKTDLVRRLKRKKALRTGGNSASVKFKVLKVVFQIMSLLVQENFILKYVINSNFCFVLGDNLNVT